MSHRGVSLNESVGIAGLRDWEMFELRKIVTPTLRSQLLIYIRYLMLPTHHICQFVSTNKNCRYQISSLS